MSFYDYKMSRELCKDDPPFYALIMAAMRKADNVNEAKLRRAFPEVWEELSQRYHATGGVLPGEN